MTMAKYLAALACLSLSANTTWADDDAQRWTTLDTTLEVTTQLTLALDMVQTLNIRPPRHENNVLLGQHPSDGTVVAYFAACGLAHAGIAYLLPRPYRNIWQFTAITFESAIVAHNFRVGLQIHF
jgi:hypothetical protein